MFMYKRCWPWLVIAGLCVIGAFSYISAQNTPKLQRGDYDSENSSPFNELLSENIRTIILSADSIQWLLIDPWVDNDSVTTLFGQPLGEILCSTIVRDSTINSRISEIVTSPMSFQQDSLTKESTFMPDFGAMFISPTDTVLVTYSLYCDICRFQCDDKLIDLNGEIIRKDLIATLKDIFPKDKFIRNLARKQ